jgi:hypothetical protein
MTTREIQQYIDGVMHSNFEGLATEAGEMMTGEEGDGRFFGRVIATRYSGLPFGRSLFLAIGETEKKLQIIKLGKSECLRPGKDDLDGLLLKELGIKITE